MKLCDPAFCTGCAACVNSCPQQCVTLTFEKDWFAYPQIDDARCIECGGCVRACPVLSKPIVLERRSQPEVLGACSKDAQSLQSSSSGGMAYQLGLSALLQGGTVFGVVYDATMKAHYAEIDTKEKLWQTQGSKYMQSEVGDSYQKIKERLKTGRRVLFVGLPCQVAGLYQYLGADDDNLVTCDLLCGGAASPKLFKRYIQFLNKKYKEKIININFRSKKLGYGFMATLVDTDNKSKFLLHGAADAFVCYTGGGYVREACFSCPYTSPARKGDITLGDYWIGDSAKTPQGASLVLVNSDKGKRALMELEREKKIFRLPGATVDALQNAYRVMREPASKPKDYEQFFLDAGRLPWKSLYRRYIVAHRSRKDKILYTLPRSWQIRISKVNRIIQNYVKK